MDDIKDLLVENIRLFDKIVSKTDEINKRLVVAFIVATLAFTFAIFSMTFLYFRTDYDYPDMEQTQTVTQSVNKGVDE